MNPVKKSDGELLDAKAVSGPIRHTHEPIRDMLLWLKCVAVDLSKGTTSSNSQEPLMRNLCARKVLYLACEEAPWRKRTFHLLQETVTAVTNQPSKKQNDEGSRKKGKSSVASYSEGRNGKKGKNSVASYSEGRNGKIRTHSSVRTIVDNLSQKRIPSGHSSHSVLGTDNEVLLVLDSDDSANSSNPLHVKKPFVRSSQNRPIKSLKSGKNDPKNLLRGSPYPHNSVKGSNSSSSSKAKKPKTQNGSDMFIGDYPQMAVPVGPRFQAVIPDLVLPNMDTSINGRSDDSTKWLGTRIWPIESTEATISMELIGKGRPNSCLCNYPGSPECIKFHLLAKKLQLQIDLSTAYFSWKFDKMGEDVARWWTPNEEKRFSILVKANPVSKDMSFLEPALKCFQPKSRESIVSYYFNVFVLRRMKRQTRLARVVDSDDDEFDDDGVGQSKEDHSMGVKNKYLTVPR